MLGMVLAGTASATTVYVVSVGHSNAQIIINASAVRTIQVGETTPEGVRLEDIRDGVAVLEVDKRLVRLGIGQTISPDVTIRMDGGGQFRLTAFLNGAPLRAIVDTGASGVAIGSATARQLGIDYLRGRRTVVNTANGSVPAYVVNIARVQVGEIVVLNVLGLVQEGSDTISKGVDVLLGNSFLQHVQMRRTGDTMVLTKAKGM
jgi:aspartyl protease family protein